ncbi:MAG: hypothetical protein M3A44_05820 [Gammaproteobacteria bacterium]
MSLSLNNLFDRITPRSKTVFGIGIGRDRLSVAHVVTTKQARYIKRIKQINLPFTLFSGAPTPEIGDALSSVLDELCCEVKRSHIPIQIALPDPAVSLRVFDLDAIPKTSKEQLALAHWRFSKELHLGGRAIECSCQPIGVDNGKYLLLAMAVDRDWLLCLKEACRTAGVISTVIDMAACYRFNRFYGRFSCDGADMVVISLDDDAWTVSISDEQGRLRFVRSRWRETMPERAKEYQEIAAESERLVRIYTHSAPGRSIKNIHTIGNAQDISGVADLLDKRMVGKCIRVAGGVEFMSTQGMSGNTVDSMVSTLSATILR